MYEVKMLSYSDIYGHPSANEQEEWFVPDPAEQFANPYLAMGNNPVVYVDPDGEFIFTASAIIIGAMIGSFTGAVAAGYSGADAGHIMASFGVGGLAGAVGGAVDGNFAGFSAGFVNGAGNAYLNGANFGEGLMMGLKDGGIGAATGALIGGAYGGLRALDRGNNFWTGDDVHIGRSKFSLNNTPRPADKIYMARASAKGMSSPISMENLKNLENYPIDVGAKIKEELSNYLHSREMDRFKITYLADSRGKVAVISEGYIPHGQRVSIVNPNHLNQTVIYGSNTTTTQAASFYNVNRLELMMSAPIRSFPTGPLLGNTFISLTVTPGFENYIYYYVP